MYETTEHSRSWTRHLEEVADRVEGGGLAYDPALIPAEAEGTSPDSCRFFNAGTCPDCGSGMVRLGSCLSCLACGYQSCGG